MATAGDTFERKEKKYLITEEQCRAIKQALEGRMRLDDYGRTRIDSLYLDTPERSLICRSLEKPLYKEKLRVRSYGAFLQADVVFVELKKKFKGIVYKRRVRMSARGARAWCAGFVSYERAQELYPVPDGSEADLASGKVQIAREIEACFGRYEGLEPSMLISCQREAWCPVDGADGDCVDRITFDEDIMYVDVREGAATQQRRVTPDGQVVMEIKCAGGYPTWLCDLLAELEVYPRSFSKYGTAFQLVLAEKARQKWNSRVAAASRPARQVLDIPLGVEGRAAAARRGAMRPSGAGRRARSGDGTLTRVFGLKAS